MNYCAFYWTLPVTWAGFTSLPRDATAAAGKSRTIRYQVERVRRWVKEEGGTLLREVVFLETRPDRGTEAIQSDIRKLLAEAERLKARVILVDFSQAYGWRANAPLAEALGDSGSCMFLPPDPILIDGAWWDPVAHFRAWRAIDAAEREGRIGLRALAQASAAELRSAGATWPQIARQLNDAGIRTPNGRAWTADNARKLLSQAAGPLTGAAAAQSAAPRAPARPEAAGPERTKSR